MSTNYSGACFCGAVEVRGVRKAGGDGVLPLPVLQVVGCVARQCLHALAGKREGDKGGRSDRRLPQDREAPSPFLPNLRRTRDVETSALGTDRRILGDHPEFPFRPQLHVNYAETVLPMRDELP